MNCSKCGRALPDNANFCPGCGTVCEPKISRAVITAQMMKKMSDATRQPVPFEPFSVLRPRRRSAD